jgi:hypothetical protein
MDKAQDTIYITTYWYTKGIICKKAYIFSPLDGPQEWITDGEHGVIGTDAFLTEEEAQERVCYLATKMAKNQARDLAAHCPWQTEKQE